MKQHIRSERHYSLDSRYPSKPRSIAPSRHRTRAPMLHTVACLFLCIACFCIGVCCIFQGIAVATVFGLGTLLLGGFTCGVSVVCALEVLT